MTLELTQTHLIVGAVALVGLLLVWRSGARRAHRAAEAAHASAKAVSLVGRVVAMAAGFVGVQWLVITQADNVTLLLVVLALPDLIAAWVLTRALTVTNVGTTRRGRGDRR